MNPTDLLSAPSTQVSAHDCDVLIVGGGPAGLSLSIALSQAGLSSIVLEQQSAVTLAEPPPDGREIALTHPSVELLTALGSWSELATHEIGRIREAHVHDGAVQSVASMSLDALGSGEEHLGWIVPNHALRRSAFAVAAKSQHVRILDSAKVLGVSTSSDSATLEYQRAGAPKASLRAPLVVAADSRFSTTRRQLGVGADMTDFGRSVIVCRMRHEQPHHDIAHECFGYERTLAVLPLQDDPATGNHLCSAVVTADSADAQALMNLPAEAFTAKVQSQFDGRLGAMQLVGERHAYPLVAVYAHRFAGHRFALLGDAAVGMHPVTAHGYNLGLASVRELTNALQHAREQGQDIGNAAHLQRFARAHHRHAWPIFQGTNTVVRLFTNARPLPRLLRQLVLKSANVLPPVKSAIVQQLTGRGLFAIGAGGLTGRARSSHITRGHSMGR
ncbi:5-demethoxyubiquinol-8 5-hydroxylase UbiM [Diaphorobacter sp. HDW4A]|uniref:5-demethoxyubiquinol-8 5-hydroxylase UbiM n=1 Tax=Diaphorobacter sp. HDW4A TaxID=2714924 RepID=UPI00140C8F27|nr:5-demethoxyubiquinol-8 5-hydroxylase UbiM [Diaphorobacter sp. HDW4A]QIL82628.1 5-demethoxyubiquinol-8 5-hydroxylase UbiM [Diaphorobacter sp. HDW4A]